MNFADTSDEYPNEMNTLPKNLQQLVADAMQTITVESSNNGDLISTSDTI